MSKELIVADAKAKLVSGQDELLGKVIGDAGDQMVAEFQASLPPVDANEQAKIDAAVKAAVDPLNAKIAQDALDLQAAIQDGLDKIAAANQALADMTAKELDVEAKEKAAEVAVQGLKDAVAAFQSVLAGLPQP